MLRSAIIGLAILIGVEIVLALVAVLVYDPEAMWQGWDTVSWDTLGLGLQHPFYASLIGLELGILLGALFGHLWLFQVVYVFK